MARYLHNRLRGHRFTILTTDEERRAILALAQLESTPISTLARERLLLEAKQRGIEPSITIKDKRTGANR